MRNHVSSSAHKDNSKRSLLSRLLAQFDGLYYHDGNARFTSRTSLALFFIEQQLVASAFCGFLIVVGFIISFQVFLSETSLYRATFGVNAFNVLGLGAGALLGLLSIPVFVLTRGANIVFIERYKEDVDRALKEESIIVSPKTLFYVTKLMTSKFYSLTPGYERFNDVHGKKFIVEWSVDGLWSLRLDSREPVFSDPKTDAPVLNVFNPELDMLSRRIIALRAMNISGEDQQVVSEISDSVDSAVAYAVKLRDFGYKNYMDVLNESIVGFKHRIDVIDERYNVDKLVYSS